jgi:hypothetical protein
MHTAYVTLLGEAPVRPTAAAHAIGMRLFAVEDDPVFADLLQRTAQRLGATLDIFDPDADFDQLPLDGDYDAGIVDFNLGHLNGAQIAALYAETPVLMTSASAAYLLETKPWLRSVRTFVPKRKGVKALVETGLLLAAGGEGS